MHAIRVLPLAVLLAIGSYVTQANAFDFKNGMAWHTTDSVTGMEELCISFHVGNTNMLTVDKHYRVLTFEDMSAMDVEDCTRGLRLAKKEHKIAVFTPKDLQH